MAVLSEADRQRISRGLQRYWSSLFEEMDLTEAELKAAFNSTLPAAAQANLTAVQKTLLFCVVAAMRMGAEFLRTLIGEVD